MFGGLTVAGMRMTAARFLQTAGNPATSASPRPEALRPRLATGLPLLRAR